MSVLTKDRYASRFGENAKLKERLDPVVHGEVRSDDPGYLDHRTLKQFQDDGFLFFETLFKEEEVLKLLEEFENLKNNKDVSGKDSFITEPGSGEVRSIFQVHETSRVFDLLTRDERIYSIARQILDSDLYVHQSRINLKPGFYGKEFYWHSDFETWHVEDGMPQMRAISCSITLTDNYSFNGPLMVIPGSHKKYVVCEGQTPHNHYKKSLKRQEYGVPGDEQLKELVKSRGIEVPTGRAGSVLFFDCNLMHGSNGNITPFPRTNVFFVYNSVYNHLVDPYCGLEPRPEYIAARESCRILKPEAAGAFLSC